MPTETFYACPSCAATVARSLIQKHQTWHDETDEAIASPVSDAESMQLQPGWPTDLNGIG